MTDTRFRIGALGLVLSLGLAAPAASQQALNPATLVIRNDAAGATIGCVLSLAHFVTIAVGDMAPGESARVALVRPNGDGTLAVLRDDGRPLAIDAIFCGVRGDWSATFAALPFGPLRDPARSALTLVCRRDQRVVCTEQG